MDNLGQSNLFTVTSKHFSDVYICFIDSSKTRSR